MSGTRRLADRDPWAEYAIDVPSDEYYLRLRYIFPNGYGISLAYSMMYTDRWSLAVIDAHDGEIIHDNPIVPGGVREGLGLSDADVLITRVRFLPDLWR